MATRSPTLTSAVPSDIARRVRRRIQARCSSCCCGCRGRDSWHAWHFDRVVRDVVVLDEPERLREDAAPLPDVVEAGASSVVAYGTARFPWGVERVRAIRRVWGGGAPSRFVDWELVTLRG